MEGCARMENKFPAPAGYTKLIWHDEFEGDTLDDSKWSRIPPTMDGKVSDWNRYTSLRSDLAAVKDGCLILKGVKNDDSKSDPRPFLQGQVWTKDKFSYLYGLVEIRAKFENQKGAWPAFWMLPQNGKWPDGGEIDIMERLNSDPFVYLTCHSAWTYTMKHGENPPHGGKAEINQGEFNTYALEWTHDALVWYVNGTEVFRYPRTNIHSAQWPYDASPFYLLLDMQLGGAWVKDIAPSTLPVNIYIDYTRVWQK